MHRSVRNIYFSANAFYSDLPVAKKFSREWRRHCRTDKKRSAEPSNGRVTILSANRNRFSSFLSRQRGQLIVPRLASYAFSVLLLIKLKNVNKRCQILRRLSKNHNLAWSKTMISYFGLSGKMNSSEPISRITPTVMGTYELTLNFVGIGFQKTQGILAVERRMDTSYFTFS